ncbi:MAG: glucose-6-phosphate dehydrogenase [Betaproteobacteria bacterium]|nr:glucose-6-phosphate dehydrogenase [Betaproteobacteria bacterium]
MSFNLVIFGAKGDLSWRKLLPAMFQSERHGSLPAGGRIVAVAREPWTDAEFRTWLHERFTGIDGAKRPSEDEFQRFAQRITYVRMDVSDASEYQRLKQALGDDPARVNVFYLATSPSLFTVACQHLAAVGLNTLNCRVVLEKPLGSDLNSNVAINGAVRAVFSEEQIYRIDHYLGKPSVQNLLALRFGNALFEPLWRREWIANVEITLAEELGVEQRGGFYDATGALRDMVQNHALQLLCAVAMEPPINSSADAIRDEKLKVLRSLRRWQPASLGEHVVRGQYVAGRMAGQAVPGYADEPGVQAGSRTETFVALRTGIDNWRWAGVPFYLRTGKRLAERRASIVINFRAVPHSIFRTNASTPGRLVIHLQPKDGLELHLLTLGANNVLVPAFLDLDFDRRFGAERVGAYERLLIDVIGGRLNLFVRSDEQQEAWRWVEPVLQHWRTADAAGDVPRPYAAGTWGPAVASAMVARDGAAWSEEC